MGRKQADPTIYVIPDAAGRDHPARQPGGHHTADGEAVALMDVRHRQRLADDAGQGRRVDQLFERSVLQRLLQNVVVRVKMSRHAHVVPEFLRHFVDMLVDLFQIVARDRLQLARPVETSRSENKARHSDHLAHLSTCFLSTRPPSSRYRQLLHPPLLQEEAAFGLSMWKPPPAGLSR